MIIKPTPQRALRGHQPTRPTLRLASTADHHGRLAARLTPRDHWIIAMLWEHRVLTSVQITAMAFPSVRAGQQRLRELFQWGLLDRFQPFTTLGSAPLYYVLAPAGAAVLAATHGIDVTDLGYRHSRAIGVAHNLRLAHLAGVNEWFAALVSAARFHTTGRPVIDEPAAAETALDAWWSETRCARHFGDLVQPDAYGRWRHSTHEAEFFLEYDLGTESLTKVTRKLAGYAALADATGVITPVLFWFPTTRREAGARLALHPGWRALDRPAALPVATAAASLLDPATPAPSPADPVWQPLHDTASARTPLHLLGEALSIDAKPRPAATAEPAADETLTRPRRLPAVSPMPPAPSRRSSGHHPGPR